MQNGEASWPLDRWLLRYGWIGIIRTNKANEIQSLYRIRMTRKPHCRCRPIGNRSTRRRSCSKPVEDYQTAKRCFVVTNNKHISSSGQRLLHARREQRGGDIKRLINDSRRLMMNFKSADVDSTKLSIKKPSWQDRQRERKKSARDGESRW